MMAGGEASDAPTGSAPKVGGRLDPGWNATTWDAVAPSAPPRKNPFQMVRGAVRLTSFAIVTLLLLAPFFIARSLGGRRERFIAALWCRAGLFFTGLRLRPIGRPMSERGALLANHASWLDILAVGAAAPVHFVAKAEVERWPLFGWIGRITNTVFIARRRAEAKEQEALLARRALAGDLLCLFPEGTSSDGQRVLRFKTSLFALFYSAEAAGLKAQPVSVHYAPRAGLPDSFYGWWGRMALFTHVWDIACLSSSGVATVAFHEPIDPTRIEDRKALAAATESAVAKGRDEADLRRGG